VSEEAKPGEGVPQGDARDQQLQAYARDLAVLYRQERQAAQALAERQRDLEMLVETHGRLARCLNRDSLIDLLLETFVEQLGVSRALIYLSAPPSDSLTFVGGRARDQGTAPGRPPAVSMDHPLYRHLGRESQELVTVKADDPELATWFEDTYPRRARPRQVLCLSLPGRNRLQGCAILDGAGHDEPPLALSRRPLVALLARQAGILLENVLLYEQSQAELRTVRELYDQEQQKLIARHQFSNLIGASLEMQQIFSLLRTVADVDVPVLILGETGTGKELVAQALHYTSSRRNQPFISVNCAALPSELVESELFGHEKGAFTGAVQRRVGKVEMAESGTLFLDEIGEMVASLQAKLLRFLQERTFERVGGSQPLHAKVRILAATNQDVETAIREGKLRRDLVYRLNTITVTMPPLRERLDDVPLLVAHFVKEANRQYGCSIETVDPDVYRMLIEYDWPGNVRELRNVIDRAAILTKGGTISPDAIHLGSDDFQSAARKPAAPSYPDGGDRSLTELKQEVVEQFERSYLDRLLQEFGGNITRAARAARIDKKNFIEKMRHYNIDRQSYLAAQ